MPDNGIKVSCRGVVSQPIDYLAELPPFIRTQCVRWPADRQAQLDVAAPVFQIWADSGLLQQWRVVQRLIRA